VRIGSIFEDIGAFAAEHQAELIVMGTHGAHGWQHITGSHALKVVTSSQVPFIIVQEKAVKASGYDSIVVPMDLHKETKQKLSIVANLAQYFKSKVHVVTPDETDEFLRHQVRSNITFSEGFFKDRGIEMTSAVVPSSGFDKEVVKYAVSVDADLIAIMDRLRRPQDGCPWDLEQTFLSIAPYTIEEAYEVADAVERGDMVDLREELGDLLLQVVFHAQMAREQSLFDFGDVVEAMRRSLHSRSTIGQVYELYGADVMTLGDLVRLTARQLGLKRVVVPLPDALARLQAFAFDFVPGKPFSSDNYRSLKLDSVGAIDGLHQLGIEPTRIGQQLATILGSPAEKQPRYDRYRSVAS
jgi:NTP pyrophosphatase (non-canonical NTP hydrolase)